MRRTGRGLVFALLSLVVIFASSALPASAAEAAVTVVTAPAPAPVGTALTVQGHVAAPTAGNYEAATEVWVGSGWSRSQLSTTNLDGSFELPLTYGASTPGTYRYRLRVNVDGTLNYSDEFTVTWTAINVTLLATPSPALVGTGQTATGKVSVSGTHTVATEVWTSTGWSRSQLGTTNSAGEFTLPLTYGQSTPGTYRYRFRVTVNGRNYYSSEFSVTWAARSVTLLSGSPIVLVGSTPNARARVGVPGNHQASTEVWLGNRWSRSQLRTTNANGEVTIPLTYGRTTPGTYRYRVRIVVNGTSLYSPEFAVIWRPSNPIVVTAPTSLRVGQAGNIQARVPYGGSGTRVSVQYIVNGRWSTSQTRTTDSTGRVTLPITYGINNAGTYTWRLVSVNTYGHTMVSGSRTLSRTTGSVAPVIPDSQYDMYRGPNVTSRVILTYDDCPTSLASFRATVLAAEAADVGLALFPTGACLQSGRFDAAFARAHGHHVFNHSVNHPDLTTLSYEGVRRELSAPGVVTTYGRPPYGAHNANVRAAYRSKGMRIWLWNVDTNDWRGRSQSQIVNQVTSQARPGQTVLMHMQWAAFNGSAINQMKSGLNNRGIGVCRNYQGTVPVAPTGMWC